MGRLRMRMQRMLIEVSSLGEGLQRVVRELLPEPISLFVILVVAGY
jgi:hypothetical protein